MNNLKRVLSLVLALVLVVGCMAVASAKEFTDQEEITHTQAVEVLNALSVILGNDDGSYAPARIVTRGEMCTIIARILNGGNLPAVGSSSTYHFTDIEKHWARNYIEYCANLGIVDGKGDGTFGPDEPLTAAAAAKMLLVAAGYKADIFGFTDRDWELNTNAYANRLGIYTELDTTDTSAGLSRDNTAQMAFNTLFTGVMETTYSRNTQTGITESYEPTDTTVLEKYFPTVNDVNGTFTATSDTDDDLKEGYITVDGRSFPYDADPALLGEEVTVLYKDTDGTAGLTAKDTILVVYPNGKTTTVWATRGDVGNQKSTAAKIVVDSTTYTTLNAVPVTVDYVGDAVDKNATDGVLNTSNSELTAFLQETGGAADKIKLIINDDNNVKAIYVESLKATKVNSVTSTAIALNGVGSVALEGNEVEEGLKAGDVVVYTQFYTADTDAAFTVKKAETVSGKITGYKADVSVTVDGTVYYNNAADGSLQSLTANALTDLAGEIGSEVTLYLVGEGVAAIQKTSTTAASNYALVIADNDIETSATTLATGRVKLMLTDGSTAEYNVAAGSTLQADDAEVAAGALVKYTESSGTVSISEKVATVNGAVWNADTKQVAAAGVAETGAVIFVRTNEAKNTWKVYDIRTLRSIDTATNVAVVKNSAGKITIAAVALDATPAGATSDTVYGMITANGGQVSVSDTECTQYTVATNGDPVTINVKDNASLATGSYVYFLESSDTIYANADINVFTVDDDVNGEVVAYYAVAEYDTADKVISVYDQLEKDLEGNYVGDPDALTSIALDKDVEIFYFNKSTKKAGSDVGVNAFDPTTGYANVKVFTADGVVTKIFVETSGKCDVDGATTKGKIGDNEVAQQYAVSVDGLSGTLNGLTYKVTADTAVVAAGKSVTYTLTISGTPTADAAKDEFTFAVENLTAADKFTVKTANEKLTAANDSAKVTVANDPGEDAISGTYTITCTDATAAPVVTITATSVD